MEATVVLCDYAESVNGKLYIAGGGWTQLRANFPAAAALGVILDVPWDRANLKHNLLIALQDQDGNAVSIGDPPQVIQQQTPIEVGRPAGWVPGTPLPLVLAVRWPVLPLPAGGYVFVISVDGSDVARKPFRSVEGLSLNG